MQNKTIKQLIKETKEEFNNAVNRLKANIDAIRTKHLYGTIYEILWENNKPIRVLVELNEKFRPKGVDIKATYLFGASIDMPLAGVPVELLNSIEEIIQIYGTDLNKLIGESVEISYNPMKINSAKARLSPIPGQSLDVNWLYKSKKCSKPKGKYSAL